MIPQAIRSNLPAERLAWSLLRASQEFGGTCSDVTLASRLKDAHESPDANGCWTTQQIVSVMFGDLHAQRLRKIRAEGDKVELQNAITRGEFLNKFEVESLLSQCARTIVLIIETSELSRSEKDDIRRQLGGIRVRVRDLSGKNGAGGNGDSEEPARRKRTKSAQKKQAAEAEQPAAVPADGFAAGAGVLNG